MTQPYLDKVRQKSISKLREYDFALGDARSKFGRRACVYVTGSFGRLEAGPKSDLDLYIVTDSTVEQNESSERKIIRALNGLDEIKLKYHLIKASEDKGFPPFDGDGKYLQVHTIPDFTENLGSPEDDSKGTLTARLLMLLESRSVLGNDFYKQTIDAVIAAYFRDYQQNADRFIPAFLINDIMRMWRTFCVNYEYYRNSKNKKSRIKNFKLRYSRLLTCYSAIIHLLVVYSRQGTVHPEDVRDMIALTPTERLERLQNSRNWGWEISAELPEYLNAALRRYAEFLETDHKDKEEVAKEFEENLQVWRNRSYEFSKSLADIIQAAQIKAPHPELYRFIVI